MANYVKITDYAAKDALLTGNPSKLVRGTELGAEFDSIATADADSMKKSAMGTGVETFLGTPSSANLKAAVTDETGSGALVFANTPTLVTPDIGAATGTSLAVTTLDSTNLEVTNLKAKDGTASASIADSTGVMTIASSVLTTADINGGTIDGTVIGGSTPAAITGTTITANTGFAGALNGTVGATTPAAGTFTTLTSTGNATLGDDPATDTHTINGGVVIKNTGSGNCLLIEDAAGTDATPFVIDAVGRMLLGTTSSVTTQGSSLVAAQIHGSSGGTSNTSLNTWSANAIGPLVQLNKSRSATVGTFSTVSSGDALGMIGFGGDDGAAIIQAASITAAVDGTPGTNDMPGRLVFSTTADGASSPTTAVIIDSKQQIGIGGAAMAGYNVHITKPLANLANPGNIVSVISAGATATGTAYGNYTAIGASANGGTPYTITAMHSYSAAQGTFHADSTVTNQYGFFAGSSFTGATNNYGFHSNIAAAAGCWNFYAAGTAANYFGGLVNISGASAGQIKFPATQNASADANTLDDYEEGDFSPTVVGTTAAGTGTYSSQVGKYTKVGRKVTFQLYVQWSAHTGTGNMRVGGLPFTADSTATNYAAFSLWNSNVAMTAGNVMQANVNPGGVQAILEQVPTGGGNSVAIPIDTAGGIMIQGSYIV